MKNIRNHRRQLRKKVRLSTPRAAEPNFLHWLNRALQDERWRIVIRSQLLQAELAEIQF